MPADDDQPGEPSPYLTAREAAAYLHLNEKTLYAMIQEGGIPATKVTGKWLFPRRQVERWLGAQAIPAQDKLLVLASALNVEPEVLRFGNAVRHSIEQRQKRWDDGVGYLERETFDAFLQLPAAQRKIIREVILTFAKANAGDEASSSQ